MMLSASNIPTPHGGTDYNHPTTILLPPPFTTFDNATPQSVPTLVSQIIENAPTSAMPLGPVALPKPLPPGPEAEKTESNGADATAPSIPPALSRRPSPHSALILLCSQRTRDARCGQ